MKTQSAKAKGRRLQQWIRDVLIEKLNIHNASTPLGTLIFTDNISKFGLDSICHNTDIDDDNNYSFAIQDRIIQNKSDNEVKEALNKIDFTQQSRDKANTIDNPVVSPTTTDRLEVSSQQLNTP